MSAGRRLTPPSGLPGSNGVSFGPDGRLYVAQFLAGQISAVDLASGDIEVVVPPGGPIESPDDLAFGADGSMYVTDLVPGRVWRRDPLGEYRLLSEELRLPNGITCVGDRLFVNEMNFDGRVVELTGGELRVLTGGLAMGNAMQLGPDGCLYYPHMLTGQVFRIPPDGGEPELVAEDVHEPVAVRFDLDGTLLVLSRGEAGIVTRIDLAGGGARSLVTSGVVGLDNAAFDAENRMFVSSYASGGIAELHPDGRTRQVVDPGFDGPYGVTVDFGGRVYAGDHYRLATPDATAAGGVRTQALMIFTHGVVAEGELLHLTSQYGEVRTYNPATGESRSRAGGLARPQGIAVRDDGALVVAETDAGRILLIDAADVVTVLAENLTHPVDVALDASRHCYFSDDHDGAVYRIDDGEAVPIATDLSAPQGLTIRGDELFTIETTHHRLRAISLTTGEVRTEAENLPTTAPEATPRALFSHGMPGTPLPFAGLTTAPDGSLHLTAPGTILRFDP
ncbi:outer membrane protein assembly factor BamB family protein [Amycolatopsis magusensis]|uniref:Sugar lactone lactonase YvrE n=1 Tax=Amycolatopsis magusensis TaxID=882444 RepID=A0ABS4PQG4_9PSEU|nr:PQQ-binding-like beta-propeller repeat protein [Amycolatopsis magusensis]MBP2181664.1 sugar lactone lactonase YvrE [Amycolatopsis magusensis]